VAAAVVDVAVVVTIWAMMQRHTKPIQRLLGLLGRLHDHKSVVVVVLLAVAPPRGEKRKDLKDSPIPRKQYSRLLLMCNLGEFRIQVGQMKTV
jgi:hypothetical protein